MSTIKGATSENIYKIQKFLGLNEAPDGDSKIRLGEAAVCKNWKVTRDFNLKRRPGTQTKFTLSENAPVRGMWFGNVNGVPTGLAACDGHLWKYYEDEGYLNEPVDLGEFDTSRRVNFFAYSDIVYILNGDEYMQYDGVSFKAVTGYIPIVAISRTPNGSSSTLLEEVNKLNNMRKVWFSPDGEDNVFLLPEKDILSVHYVKNLGTGEYINPSEYNVDRINGKVTFGKDEQIEYEEGVSTYTVTDADIDDVGSVEINGAVPDVTYLPDRSGVVFDEPPSYGQIITLTSGENFTEEVTGDGESAEFEVANAGMNNYEVSVDGEAKNPEALFENHYRALQHDSYLEMKYSLKVGDVITIDLEEDAEFGKTVTVSANHDSATLAKDSYFGGDMPYKVTCSYQATSEELPEYENFEAKLCPFPEALEVDEEAFIEKYSHSIPRPLSSYNLGENEAYFYYAENKDKWKFLTTAYGWADYSTTDALTHINPGGGGGGGTGPQSILEADRLYTQPGAMFPSYTGTTVRLFYGKSKSIVLLEGRDFTISTGSTQANVYVIFILNKTVGEYFEDYYGEIPSSASAYGTYYKGTTYDLPDYVDLEDFGITYTPGIPPKNGDVIVIQFLRNFIYDGTDFYIKPHGSAVTSQTKFVVVQHAKDTVTRTLAYEPTSIKEYESSVLEYENVYYDNIFYTGGTGLSGLTGSSQISVAVSVNGRRYYENGDYTMVGKVITFSDPPAEGAVVRIDEYLENGVEKTYAADGETTVFTIGYIGAESISVSVDSSAVGLDKRFAYDPETKTVTILDTTGMEDGDIITIKGKRPPARGVNAIEICYSAGMAFTQTVNKMTNAEIFLGTQDNAVFLYGDGSNKAFYSGIDYNGKPRADYFPDLNEMSVADSNTPITGMIRHFSQLICFKSKSVYTIHFGQMTTAAGDAQYAFYITPVNKEIGNAALGQVRLVLNSPFALFANDLYEWKSNSRYSSNLSQDERSAHRISDRIYATLEAFNTEDCYCYDDNPGQEYYIWHQDKALVYNYAADAWYMYEGLNVDSMCNLNEDLLLGTADGRILLMSEDYTNDNGEAFESYWESGSMDFGRDYMRKLMSELWVGMKPENKYSVVVTAMTDKKEVFTEKTISGTAGTNKTPFVKKLKIKAKKFTYLKLLLKSDTTDTTANILSVDPKVRETGYAK